MYRKPNPPAPGDAPPAELVYAAVDHGRRRGSAAAVFRFFTLPGFAGVALAGAVSPAAGLAALVGTGAVAAWWWRAAPHREGAIFRVDRDELVVWSRDGKRERGRFRLHELAYVELDTKTIERVQEGGSLVPDRRFIQRTVGPELDNARIVLIGRGQMLPLTEEHLSYTETVEWFGRIRHFLRRQGWVPADEGKPEGEGRAARRASGAGGAGPRRSKAGASPTNDETLRRPRPAPGATRQSLARQTPSSTSGSGAGGGRQGGGSPWRWASACSSLLSSSSRCCKSASSALCGQ